MFTESTYRTMPVMGCAVSSAPALNVTGDASVDPLPGEQIFTVSFTVEVQVCDHAGAAPAITVKNVTPANRKRVFRRTMWMVS